MSYSDTNWMIMGGWVIYSVSKICQPRLELFVSLCAKVPQVPPCPTPYKVIIGTYGTSCISLKRLSSRLYNRQIMGARARQSRVEMYTLQFETIIRSKRGQLEEQAAFLSVSQPSPTRLS